MRIYTRTGDKGETGLFGGSRVRKDAPRVEAYGCVDELNAALGLAAASLDPEMRELDAVLAEIQSSLFDLGAELATPPDRAGTRLTKNLKVTAGADVEHLEQLIDRFEAALEPLTGFILPGGSHAAAALHVARAVARRAERRVVTLGASEPVNPALLHYLNRLSDLLFVLARTANRLAGVADVPWNAHG